MPESRFPSGAVTRPTAPPPPPPSAQPPHPHGGDGGDEPLSGRRRLLLFAGIAAAVLLAGIAIVLIRAPSENGRGLFDRRPEAPTDVRPPLARACPAPTGAPGVAPTGPAVPPGQATGERTTDPEAGISYAAYGPPWVPWTTVWNAGTLRVPYKAGQHFVTENDYNGASDYHASILSAAVPAADNDAYAFDLECVGRQVAADVRSSYYPQPNRMEAIREGLTELGGRPAWLSVFRLHFQQTGLRATDELVGLAILDVDRPSAAILYVSIPGTHRQYDGLVDDVLGSVRPA